MQDSGNVLARILHEVLGFVHVLHFIVQHSDEDLLHFFDSFRYLLDALQETLLHSMYHHP